MLSLYCIKKYYEKFIHSTNNMYEKMVTCFTLMYNLVNYTSSMTHLWHDFAKHCLRQARDFLTIAFGNLNILLCNMKR